MYYSGLGEKKKKKDPAAVTSAAKSAKEATAARDQALSIQAQVSHDQIPKWVWYAGAGLGALVVIALLRK